MILENLPLLIIQCLYANKYGADILTVIAILFSSLSILSGICTVMTTACSRCVDVKHGGHISRTKLFLFDFSIKELEPGIIKPFHVHSHYLLQRSLAFALCLVQNQVEVVHIQKISDGLFVEIELKFISDEQISQLMVELTDTKSEMSVNLHKECAKHLKVKQQYVELTKVNARQNAVEMKKKKAATEIVYDDEGQA